MQMAENQKDIDKLNQIGASPLQLLEHPLLKQKQLKFFLKRDDLLVLDEHQGLCGNKVRKLHYNLLEARKQGFQTILTFGGAFSNHIVATASAGQLFGFKTIGVIRGEENPNNPSLSFAQKCGMHLHYVSRSMYREKEKETFIEALQAKFGSFYLIPEGGTNSLALKGCEAITSEIKEQLDRWDYLCVACGTGGTLGGIIAGSAGRGKIIGFSALKGNFLTNEVHALLQAHLNQVPDNWHLQTDYHFGGFAKFKPNLIEFINDFKSWSSISLEPIYTGKMMYGIFDLIKKNYFPPNSSIIAVHTGGLQGIQGFNQRFKNLLV